MSTNISPADFKLLAGDNKEGTKFPGEPAMRILSLGAGVQSSTMALMAEEGAFGVKPDAAIFADTGWEPPQVYEHLEWLKTKLSYPVYTIQYGNIREDIMNAMSESGNRFASAPFLYQKPRYR
jgi:3'-phosphoadenosine 5'-phosphosulfate sulfotransferase (PAPS reductase)/FAD synthetase